MSDETCSTCNRRLWFAYIEGPQSNAYSSACSRSGGTDCLLVAGANARAECAALQRDLTEARRQLGELARTAWTVLAAGTVNVTTEQWTAMREACCDARDALATSPPPALPADPVCPRCRRVLATRETRHNPGSAIGRSLCWTGIGIDLSWTTKDCEAIRAAARRTPRQQEGR